MTQLLQLDPYQLICQVQIQASFQAGITEELCQEQLLPMRDTNNFQPSYHLVFNLMTNLLMAYPTINYDNKAHCGTCSVS